SSSSSSSSYSSSSYSSYSPSIHACKDSKELLLNRVDSSEKDVMVRQDFDIPPEEEAFLLKRKEVVASALQKVLNIPLDLSKYKVPTVAVVCSGGGSRAMTGTYGSLKGLQSLGLLDVITYMTAVSGSTWAFASLFSDDSWSKKNLDEEIASKKIELSKSTRTIFFWKLWYYYSERHNRMKEGYPVSIVDLWGLVVEQLIFGEKHTKTLSDQKMAVFKGQNPLPIYTAVEMDDSASAQPHHDWCEFTPFEVGFFKDGAFVSAKDFGSEFHNGHVVKNLPETRIPFLLGIWSSFFSANLLELWTYFRDLLKEGNANQKCQSMGDVIHCRPLISKVFNFLKGLFRNNTSLEDTRYVTNKDTDSDAVPNKLSPTHSYLNLVDSGHAINIAFPPVLRPHRRADIILSLNYSLETDHLQDLKKTQQYCIDHKIPFPKIDLSKYPPEPKEEVYVFMDEENPDAPMVLHFPLVNVSFKEYKEPGVKRTTEEELKEGEIDLSSSINSTYNTLNLTYTPEDFQHLVNLTKYNITNNKKTIINALKTFLKLE
ncbi:cytosolic phospholipase A2 zeta-like, partial [Clarias gariepinus]|uniref:cytosolic phospholipase A2 zeta-like n=1 Tax=Clarias gariepinus TaxID=13013 RepID=UPI00234E2782